MTNTDIERILGFSDSRPLCVLSPHLDDAVWSLGAMLQTIAASGRKVSVITVFSITTQTATRKSEDKRALEATGCTAHYLDFSDAILDGRPPDTVFNIGFEPAPEAVAAIAAKAREFIPADAIVAGPSGFGGHVDHLTTRAVAALLENTVIYYEDMPYAAREARLENAQAFFAAHHLHRTQVATTQQMIEAHMQLYEIYASQRQDHHVEQIRQHLEDVGFGIWK